MLLLLLSLLSVRAHAAESVYNEVIEDISKARFLPVTISSFFPANGIAGTTVTITGWGFDSNKDFNKVKFGVIPAKVVAAADSRLIVIVPEGAVNAPISVTNMINWAANKAQKTRARYVDQTTSNFIITPPKEQKQTPEIKPVAIRVVPAAVSAVALLATPTPSETPAPVLPKSNPVNPVKIDDSVLMTSTQSNLNFKPYGLACEGDSLFISASEQNQIYKISLETGQLTLLAGTGDEGNANGAAAAASFNFPLGITSDRQNLYVADSGNNLIRKINIASGQVSTFAGSGIFGLTDGLSKAATFATPSGITTDGNSLFVTDTSSHRIRKIEIATSETNSLSGSGIPGEADGVGMQASFNLPSGITTDGNNLYITDSGSNKIRKITLSTKHVETLAGTGTSGASDGAGDNATFNTPSAIATSANVLFIVDQMNHTVRKISGTNNAVSTVSGTGVAGNGDGISTSATFNAPFGICASGNALYVADTNNLRIRKLEYYVRVSSSKNR